jgi:hypothetical protein
MKVRLVLVITVETELSMTQTWGEAYGSANDGQTLSQFAFRLNGVIQHEVPMHDQPVQHSYQMLPGAFTLGSFDVNWPDAINHPYFYVGIYAAIGLGLAVVNVISTAIQWTGALRASRILFK